LRGYSPADADEARLQEAVTLFGLPKAEVVRRLIRASVQAGPALSAENTRVVSEPAQFGWWAATSRRSCVPSTATIADISATPVPTRLTVFMTLFFA
jgi:hypothetical protein